MQKLLKQNAFTENKFQREYEKLIKQDALTEKKFQNESRNYLNKMC
jgi:hypothetical protein